MDTSSANWKFITGMNDFEFANDQFQIRYPSESLSFDAFATPQYSVHSLENNTLDQPPSSSDQSHTFNHKTNTIKIDPSIETFEVLERRNNGKKKASQVMERGPNCSDPQHHVIAERKRREKLNEKFVALSAILPGLKKLDKASVVGQAANYIKLLEEKVELLEEQVKKIGENDSSSGGNSLEVIQARVSDKNVIIRIHWEYERKNGILVTLLGKLQQLHLSVVTSSLLPFGDHAIDVIVIAEMDPEFQMTVRELVSKLRMNLL